MTSLPLPTSSESGPLTAARDALNAAHDAAWAAYKDTANASAEDAILSVMCRLEDLICGIEMCAGRIADDEGR